LKSQSIKKALVRDGKFFKIFGGGDGKFFKKLFAKTKKCK
jgi:hypothetical protein